VDSKYKKIICSECKKETGYTEEIIVKQEELKEDIKCPHCGAVIITKQVDYC
jgi:DNA-directed RNA polymerase subunit RPC12/RpoP